MDPNNPVTHLTRAVVMQVIGDLPEALISAQRAIELDQTNNRDIYLTATQVLIGLGRHSDAVDMARRGIARVPDPRNQLLLRVELARALALNGQLTEALNEIAATLVIDPTDSAAQQLRTQLQAGVVR
jgi:tetratricopeptide (TPR) repeat protein